MKNGKHKVGLAIAALLAGIGMTGSVAGHSYAASAHTSKPHAAVKHAAVTFPLTVKDDVGRTIRIPHKPVRILSLTLGTDEMLMSMVPPKDIIGVDYYSTIDTYSHIAGIIAKNHVQVVGGASGLPDVEKLIAMRPDLVLVADYTNQKVVKVLQNLNIPVYEFSSFNSFADIESHILVLGKLVGEPAAAAKMEATMKAQLAGYVKTAPKKKLSVLYYSWGDAAGANTTANDLIRYAGGVNAAASLQGWQQVSTEQVIKMNPDVIIVPDDSGAADAEWKKFLATPAFAVLKAVKEHHVYTAADADLSDVAQYAPLGVKDVQAFLRLATHS